MTDFTDPIKMHSCLGDYWYSIYYSSDQVGDYVAALCFNREQWDYQFKDTKDCLSRHKTPVFDTIKVKPLTVKYSDFLESSKIYAKYDGTYAYNGNLFYDVPILTEYAIRLPDNIKNIGYVSNKLIDGEKQPAVVDGNLLKVYFEPFSICPVTNIYDEDGKVVDKSITLWLFDVSLDNEDMYYQYGYIFNIHLPASNRYNQLINVLYDSLINGPTTRTLLLYLSTVTGIPVAITDREVVKSIVNNIVTTDHNIYECSCSANIVVNIGDVLTIGDSITDELTVYNYKTIDDSIKAVSLDRRYIGLCIDEIVFENEDKALVATTENGYTRVDVPVLANRKDKALFNDTLFSNGIDNNKHVDEDIEKAVLNAI